MKQSSLYERAVLIESVLELIDKDGAKQSSSNLDGYVPAPENYYSALAEEIVALLYSFETPETASRTVAALLRCIECAAFFRSI